MRRQGCLTPVMSSRSPNSSRGLPMGPRRYIYEARLSIVLQDALLPCRSPGTCAEERLPFVQCRMRLGPSVAGTGSPGR